MLSLTGTKGEAWHFVILTSESISGINECQEYRHLDSLPALETYWPQACSNSPEHCVWSCEPPCSHQAWAAAFR